MPSTSTQRMLAALDLSSMDEYILSFLSQNAHVLTDKKIQFIHVDEERTDGDNSESQGDAPHQEKMARLKARIAKINKSSPEMIDPDEVKVVAGDPEEEIKRWSKAQDIGLLVLGQKPANQHEVEVKRLVKRPGSSLLLVPKKEDYTIKKVCVATDFSEICKAAVKAADNITQQLGAKLVGFHTYQVPSGYHKLGKDHRESAKVMEDNARKEAQAFLEASGVNDIEMAYAYDEKEMPAERIAHFAQENQIDLLVMGSKGRTAAASVLLGSIAKKLTQVLHDIPMMIIKEKNENMNLLDALKEV